MQVLTLRLARILVGLSVIVNALALHPRFSVQVAFVRLLVGESSVVARRIAKDN